MRVSIAQLKAAGMTNDQIVKLMEEREADRREQNRKAQINHRARQHEGDLRADIADSHIKKEVSKKERKGRKTVMPVDWRPTVAEEDTLEFERFANYCKANAKLYADWDAAWRNWRTSPYRGKNGSLHVRPSGQQAGGLAEAIAKVRSRLGADADRPPDVLVPQDRLPKPRGFHRDAGGDLGGLSAGDRGVCDRPEDRPAAALQVAADASGSSRSLRSGDRLANEDRPELRLVTSAEVAPTKIQYRR